MGRGQKFSKEISFTSFFLGSLSRRETKGRNNENANDDNSTDNEDDGRGEGCGEKERRERERGKEEYRKGEERTK